MEVREGTTTVGIGCIALHDRLERHVADRRRIVDGRRHHEGNDGGRDDRRDDPEHTDDHESQHHETLDIAETLEGASTQIAEQCSDGGQAHRHPEPHRAELWTEVVLDDLPATIRSHTHDL